MNLEFIRKIISNIVWYGLWDVDKKVDIPISRK